MSLLPEGYSFHILPRVQSTNMYAMELLHAGLAGNGDVFFTNEQLEGKGQRGKTWYSFPGESITMSLVIDTSKLSVSQFFRLSAVVALAAHDFLEEIVSGNSVTIKWPNDLYYYDRKAGGILIENLLNGGAWKWSVIGIGINVNQKSFPAELPYAVSIQMATGENYDCAKQAKILCSFVETRWQQLFSGDWEGILNAYNRALYGRGQVKKLKKGNVVTPCIIKRVDGQGTLIAGDNEEWRFEHGEVEWIRES